MFARAIAVMTFGVALSTATGVAQTSGVPSSWTFLGVWKFNPAKSDVQTARLTFTEASSGEMTLTYSGLSYPFRIDGKERPAVFGVERNLDQSGTAVVEDGVPVGRQGQQHRYVHPVA
jgi:hypothetical protein